MFHRRGMTSLYQLLLDDAFHSLPAPVRELHGHCESVVYAGRGSVERGTGAVAIVVGTLMRFPPAMHDTNVVVRFAIRDGVETWTRQFGTHHFSSKLSARSTLLNESFGWVNIRFRLTADTTRLEMLPVRWSALGIPLPKMFWPQIVAHEYAEDGKFCFHVEARLPWGGLVVRYRGHLRRETVAAS